MNWASKATKIYKRIKEEHIYLQFMVDSFISKRVWSLPCWDLTETSKRDDGIDLLKDKQALQRLTETAEKAKMDLSSLTQTNIRLTLAMAVAMAICLQYAKVMQDAFLLVTAVKKRSVREVAELYGSEKSFIVEVQRALSGLHSTALIALNGSKMELLPTVSDPLLIKDGSETKLLYSVSDPLLIRDESETECNYNCTIYKNLHLCSVSVPFLNSVSNPSLIRNGNTFLLLIESATTILETE
ncbi:hypothetical protein Syun_012104 [Stephania yunnanensis]|uniref:Uncharacterized protein n=1 Tax=Stephania yunnanensis TaxID=152371 RepID=A0AAP0PH70_9MAGN